MKGVNILFLLKDGKIEEAEVVVNGQVAAQVGWDVLVKSKGTINREMLCKYTNVLVMNEKHKCIVN